MAKTPLKSNKKRRMGTSPCILFCASFWRRRRDSQGATRRNSEQNNFANVTSFRNPDAVELKKARAGPCASVVLFVWRRRRDSNPRALAGKRFSRPPRYDHFDTPPNILSLNTPCRCFSSIMVSEKKVK